jgi:hypothetical protein
MIGGSFNTDFGVYMFDSSTTTNLSATVGVSTVPEPSALVLFSLGVTVILLLYLRGRQEKRRGITGVGPLSLTGGEAEA